MRTFAILLTLLLPTVCYGEVSHPGGSYEAWLHASDIPPVRMQSVAVVRTPVVRVAVVEPRHGHHWTHPGSIESHLRSGHGLSSSEIAGLSHEQKLTLHDNIHEGRGVQYSYAAPRVVAVAQPRVTYVDIQPQPVVMVSNPVMVAPKGTKVIRSGGVTGFLFGNPVRSYSSCPGGICPR